MTTRVLPRLILLALAAIALSASSVNSFTIRPGGATPSVPHSSARIGHASTSPKASLSTVCHASRPPKNNKKEEGNSFSLSFDISLHKDRLLIRCLLAIIGYMAVGVVSFSRVFERWSIVDSLYFSVVTFTTVG
mmetsp:Transcript_7343/g.12335  ORF Transcript_7343/g.12335 Transcript_7343/m.12335 type:complete len:134 (-) Transcript_7343:61-462(-)